MINELEERTRIGLWLALPKASLVACRKLLFENGVSLQELFSQIIVMMENKDPRIKGILESAKTDKYANKRRQLVFTNPKAIYAALGQKDPLKDNKE
jgi:hypothetical protein